jgi:DNA-binding transcriptional regulator YhcF (GntR family)
MGIDLKDNRSIYIQISEQIEDQILQDILFEEDQVPSTNQLAALYRINPATAAKGISILVDEGVVYKQRGIGMFIATGAKEQILSKRRQAFSRVYIEPLLTEAERLGIHPDEICSLINTLIQSYADKNSQRQE